MRHQSEKSLRTRVTGEEKIMENCSGESNLQNVTKLSAVLFYNTDTVEYS